MSAAPTARPRTRRARPSSPPMPARSPMARLRFHTDRTDVVGLLCVRQARAGGVSKLASTPAIHNAILAKRPDLLDELFKDYLAQPLRRGRHRGTTETAYPLPIFGLRDGKFTSHYSLTFIEAGQLAAGVPKLTAAQKEAIDAPDGDGAGALLRDDARARRPAADQQPRHLSRPHAVRGRSPRRHEPAAAAHLAHHAQQPAAARPATRSCGAASTPTRRAAASSR